jgi:hypothetical protein
LVHPEDLEGGPDLLMKRCKPEEIVGKLWIGVE